MQRFFHACNKNSILACILSQNVYSSVVSNANMIGKQRSTGLYDQQSSSEINANHSLKYSLN